MSDFLDFYYPDSVPADNILAVRSRLTILHEAVSDVDAGPNAPFGDLHVTPAARHVALMEEALRRLQSDLDLENTAAGVTYNCEFVRKYIAGMGVYDDTDVASWGIVRLVFPDRLVRALDRSTLFQVGDNTYTPYMGRPGPLHLIPAGTTAEADSNFAFYKAQGPAAWVVDLLVFGTAGATAVAGAAASAYPSVDGMVAARTLSEISAGQPPTSLQIQAQRVRDNFHPRTPVTRGGAANTIRQRFPEIKTLAAVISGDPEMQRDINNPGAIAGGMMDLLVRGSGLLRATVVMDFDRHELEAGAVGFCGLLELPEIPIRILSVSSGGNALGYEIISFSSDPEKAPRLASSYSETERLLIRIRQTYPSGDPLIPQFVDGSRVYGRFEITYEFDPALRAVSEYLRGSENQSPALNTLVRWFLPIVVDTMTVTFNRRAGVQLNLATPRAEILETLGSHHLDNPATAAQIADSMYYGGAHSVERISITGRIEFSIASSIWPGLSFAMPSGAAAWAAFIAECEEAPTPNVTSFYEPELLHSYPELGAASGARNTTWLISSENLKFVESRSL